MWRDIDMIIGLQTKTYRQFDEYTTDKPIVKYCSLMFTIIVLEDKDAI